MLTLINYLVYNQFDHSVNIPLILLSVPYIVWLDRHLVDPRDGVWHFGAWIAGRDDWDRQEIFHHLRAWAVKGFFLAFMISIVPGGFRDIVKMNLAYVATNPVCIAKALKTGIILEDVQIATIGYMLTMKPLDAHIRTANPYGMAWVAALVCYPPFILMNGGPLDYQVNGSDWGYWLQGHDTLMTLWGVALVFLVGIYAWAMTVMAITVSITVPPFDSSGIGTPTTGASPMTIIRLMHM